MNSNIIVPYVKKSISDSDSGNVILDQAKWSENSDIITRLDIVSSLSDSIYGTDDFDPVCTLNGNEFDTALYAFPYPADLAFTVDITRGKIFAPLITLHFIQESISFSLTTEETTRYPIVSLLGISRITGSEIFDSDGNITSMPNITFDGRNLIADKPVYMTVIVTYKSKRYRYPVTVEANEDIVENYFECVAYAWWNGGIRFENINPPNSADSDYENSQNCITRSQLKVTGDDPDDPIPKASPSDKYVDIDYCTQEVRK